MDKGQPQGWRYPIIEKATGERYREIGRQEVHGQQWVQLARDAGREDIRAVRLDLFERDFDQPVVGGEAQGWHPSREDYAWLQALVDPSAQQAIEIVRRLADVYTVDTDQIAVIRLVHEAHQWARARIDRPLPAPPEE